MPVFTTVTTDQWAWTESGAMPVTAPRTNGRSDQRGTRTSAVSHVRSHSQRPFSAIQRREATQKNTPMAKNGNAFRTQPRPQTLSSASPTMSRLVMSHGSGPRFARPLVWTIPFGKILEISCVYVSFNVLGGWKVISSPVWRAPRTGRSTTSAPTHTFGHMDGVVITSSFPPLRFQAATAVTATRTTPNAAPDRTPPRAARSPRSISRRAPPTTLRYFTAQRSPLGRKCVTTTSKGPPRRRRCPA
jgi:hypothetical protein